MTEKEFRCFQIYTGLKLYFNGRFDWIKYHGKIGIKPSAYEKRKDKWFFQKLSKKYNESELINFFVSNFVYDGSSKWIGDLILDYGEDNYLQWKLNNENLTYNFERDCKAIKFKWQSPLNWNKSFNFLFINDSILQMVINQEIMLETLVILNECCGFYVHNAFVVPFGLMSTGTFNPLWEDSLKPILIKYTPFVNFDKLQMKYIINKYFKSVL